MSLLNLQALQFVTTKFNFLSNWGSTFEQKIFKHSMTNVFHHFKNCHRCPDAGRVNEEWRHSQRLKLSQSLISFPLLSPAVFYILLFWTVLSFRSGPAPAHLSMRVHCLFLCLFDLLAASLLSCVWLATPWTVAHQAPLFMGLTRWGYWSGLPFPSPGDLPDPGIKPV